MNRGKIAHYLCGEGFVTRPSHYNKNNEDFLHSSSTNFQFSSQNCEVEKPFCIKKLSPRAKQEDVKTNLRSKTRKGKDQSSGNHD